MGWSILRGNRLFKFVDRYVGIFFCFYLGLVARVLKIISKSKIHEVPSSILIIKLSAMGDTVLLIPALRALRERYPGIFISIVVTYVNKEVVENCPYLNELILFDLKEYFKNPLKILLFLKKLRRGKNLLAFDFDQWLRISPLLSYFSGAKERIGFKTAKQERHFLYTKIVSHSKKRHEVECFLDLIRALDIKIRDRSLRLWIERGDEDYTQSLLHINRITADDLLIDIHPGCGGIYGYPRQWDEKRYVKVANYLIQNYKARIVLTGGKEEINLVEGIASLMKIKPLIVAGRLSFGQLVALIKRCCFTLSGNTGIIHLASAVGTPSVVLHGPTNVQKWGPVDKKCIVVKAKIPCSPCLYLGFEYGCKKHTCMDLISVDEVTTSTSVPN